MTSPPRTADRRLGLSPRGWTVAGAIVLLALLELAPRAGWVDEFSLPPLSKFLPRAGELVVDGEFWSHDLFPSLLAIALSFVVASILGIVLGLLIWRFPLLRRTVDPWLTTYYAIPTFALYPLLVVVVGVGLVPIVALGALLAVVAVITATIDGLDATPRPVLRLADSLQLSPWSRTTKILLPAALEQVSVGLRLALSYSLIGVLASEFVLSTHGLGHFISDAYNSFHIVDMYAGIVLVFVLALAVNWVVGGLLIRRQRRISG